MYKPKLIRDPVEKRPWGIVDMDDRPLMQPRGRGRVPHPRLYASEDAAAKAAAKLAKKE